MNWLVLDVETSIGPNHDGNPFTKSNKLCLVGTYDGVDYRDYDIEYSDSPYGALLEELKKRIEECDLLINHNIKFDLHWLRRYIPDISFPPIYDTQLAEFILSNQTWVMPSLQDVGMKRFNEGKIDVVKDQYWKLGIDTPAIPKEVLFPYCEQDVRLTWKVFQQQREELTQAQRLLASLQFQDLLVLQEMEWNGLLYNCTRAKDEGAKAQARIKEIDEELHRLVPFDWINWGSSDHVSCVLYGGQIHIPIRETVVRILKNGRKKEYERWGEQSYEFPRLCDPIRGSEGSDTQGRTDADLAAENRRRTESGKRSQQRIYSVGEPILRKLKTKARASSIIKCLLERSEITKLDGTYYTGLLDKIANSEWGTDMLHGQFNQSVARTSRLSSSAPNLQNFAGKTKELFYSRYE